MKAVILAGGRGTRMGSNTDIPKPLMEIGDQPIVAHVIDTYLAADVTEFVLCCGYKFEQFVAWLDGIGERDGTASPAGERRFSVDRVGKACTVTLVDTGEATHSAGRLTRIRHHVDSTFFLTYADGLSDVDLAGVLKLHRRSGAVVTMTAFPLALRFGVVELVEGEVIARGFKEKPVIEAKWCNGGFYVVEPQVIDDDCRGDEGSWEADVLPRLAAERQLAVFRHEGFWASMDFPHQHEALQDTWREHGPIWLGKRPERAGH